MSTVEMRQRGYDKVILALAQASHGRLALRLPAGTGITGTSWGWTQVDRLAKQACTNTPLVDREPPDNRRLTGLDHCVEQREFARRLYPELAAAIEFTFGQVNVVRAHASDD